MISQSPRRSLATISPNDRASESAPLPSNLLILRNALSLALLVFLVSIGAQWLVYQELLHDPGGMRIVSPLIAAVVTGVLAMRLQAIARERRVQSLRRYQIIADMNHHVRNALEVISMETYVSALKEAEHMREALNRIDWALKEVLPGLNDPGNYGL
jgi:signal transduction histidine kinase